MKDSFHGVSSTFPVSAPIFMVKGSSSENLPPPTQPALTPAHVPCCLGLCLTFQGLCCQHTVSSVSTSFLCWCLPAHLAEVPLPLTHYLPFEAWLKWSVNPKSIILVAPQIVSPPCPQVLPLLGPQNCLPVSFCQLTLLHLLRIPSSCSGPMTMGVTSILPPCMA